MSEEINLVTASQVSPMVKLMVPLGPEISQRIEDFYGTIGWRIGRSAVQPVTYVSPSVKSVVAPRLDYEQTGKLDIVGNFMRNPDSIPSQYCRGFRLARLQSLVSISLLVPSNEDVETILQAGGELLAKHTYARRENPTGHSQFSFNDPFNYGFSVVSSTGVVYESAAAAYDSVFVSKVTRQGSPDEYLITQKNLKDYSTLITGRPNQGSRVYGVLATAIRRPSPERFRDFMVIEPDSISFGLQPARLQDIVNFTEEHQELFKNLGPLGRELLTRLYQELHPEQDA